MALRAVGTAGYGLLLAFSPGINPTEWLDMVEDFFLVNDVPSARQAASARLLMTKATSPPGHLRQQRVRSSLRYASVDYASERTSRSETLLAKWLKKLRLWEPATLTKARQLTERLVEIEEEIKEGRRRAVNEDATENGGLDKAVDSLARGLEKMEAAQDRPSRLRSTRRPTECFECGDLGHFRRDCPQLRTRTLPARPLTSGIRDRRLLAMMELKAGHATSVVVERLFPWCHSQPGKSPPDENTWKLPEAPPSRRRAKGAPLRPGSVAAAGWRLEGTNTRRSRVKLSCTQGSWVRIFLTSTSS
ncbi:hypothetical protein T4E_3885 [Trichinella pseudospiralis]|uniref:CCHC-type domain-containing protein n=1 Tax=Trichinella pseudospiralis TaxID=6337 RepID=A0A0V0YMQ4_TRIPS|nr:hypothetical protein T4E_3885 [Trichinella pseudospiralis]